MNPKIYDVIKEKILNGDFSDVLGQGIGCNNEPFDFVVPGDLQIEFVSWSKNMITMDLNLVDSESGEKLIGFGTYTIASGESIILQNMPPWPIFLDRDV